MSRYAIFALDSNVLLNLYGVGESTREALLDILRQLALSNRLWLPHRSALEFQWQRPRKILEQIQPAKELRAEITKVLATTEKALQELGDHPFIDESSVLGQMRDTVSRITDELLESEDQYSQRLSDDQLRDAIDEIFTGAVGSKYSRERLQEIYADGKLRYKLRLPPGYADSKAHGGDKDEPDCYGDLVIWKQILDEAKRRDRPFVFVTQDWRKGDWFWKASPEKRSSRLLGPRPELVEEMLNHCGKRFHVCRPSSFSEWMSRYLRKKLPVDAVAELEEQESLTFPQFLSLAGNAVLRFQKLMSDVANSPVAQAFAESAARIQECGNEVNRSLEQHRAALADIALPSTLDTIKEFSDAVGSLHATRALEQYRIPLQSIPPLSLSCPNTGEDPDTSDEQAEEG